ncbi:MAG: nucleoside kinase [Bacilli bacterium]
MFEEISIKVMGETKVVQEGTTLYTLSKEYQSKFKYKIVLAKENGLYKELNEKITGPCDIVFYDLLDRMGNRVYVNGLVYLNVYAVKELYGPDANIMIEHSIDKGLCVKTNFPLTKEIVNEISLKMQSLASNDLDISKVNIERTTAMSYFLKTNDVPKYGMMKYNTNTFITLYHLGNLYNYFYTLMPITTSMINTFELTYLNENEYVLRYPNIYTKKLDEYVHHEKMLDVFKESRNFAKLIHVSNVYELNKVVSKGRVNDLIRIDEVLQNNRLLEVSKELVTNKKEVKIVLLAGPSSSGKTTTCRKLQMYLESFGVNPTMISMDNYFVERNEAPLDKDGNKDYETIDAIDLSLFNKQIEELLDNKTVKIPTYNFLTGSKEYCNELKIEGNGILLIEGIHALNPLILKDIPSFKKYKIYVSALTELNLDDHNRVSTTDNRLLRRMIRDSRTRGYKVEDTLKSWPMVRNGEEKYIFPYQDEADFIFNTALIYEIGVLKTFLEPLLFDIDITSPYYEEAKRLLNFLRFFMPIPERHIPNDSLLREFIGDSCFE